MLHCPFLERNRPIGVVVADRRRDRETLRELGIHDDFDTCIEWSNKFYFLTPIPEGPYLLALFRRLQLSGMKLSLDYDSLVSLGASGLMSCSCSFFLHRAWCIHSCVCAFKRGIIVGYPENKDPTRRGKGRPVSEKKLRKCWERDYEMGGLCEEAEVEGASDSEEIHEPEVD